MNCSLLTKRLLSLGSAGCLLVLTACDSQTEEMIAPPPPVSASADAVSLTPNSATPASAPAADTTKAVFVQPDVISTTDPSGYSQKDINKIIEHLDWFAENYISQKSRIPTLEELKAWKDPNYPLGLPEWPKAPAGKRWAMSERSGQFSLVDDKP
ncbi:MAG: hypothetical protein K0Q55_353 [Verrucomicrobia bacterium]|jgi:hypothetical protein|nr:hypothetical protein [Verrucomicrobiota bacterium]